MKRRYFPYVVFVVLVGLIIFGVTQKQYIRDTIKLRGYSPPPAVEKLAEEATMTDPARRVFYVNQPLIADRSVFTNYCQAKQEQTIVLGCYHGNQNGIYLFDVTDERLAGVELVTAAHELLHAAYDRLSGDEKDRLNQQLQAYYDNELTDERIKSTIDSYRITEPNDVVNEMHSIFATEIAALPAELETYYERYFQDRQAIVKVAAAYEAEFSSRRAQIAADDKQLSEWRTQIANSQASLNRAAEEIETQRRQLEAQRQSGDAEAYNAAVPAYNAKVDSYNTRLAQLRSLTSRYNQLVEERNQLASQIDVLVKAISSNDLPEAK